MPASPSASMSARGRLTRRLRRLASDVPAASSKALRRALHSDRVARAAGLEEARRHSAGAENKDLARTRAIARWPAHADLFARKRDVDRAEACLIGWPV